MFDQKTHKQGRHSFFDWQLSDTSLPVDLDRSQMSKSAYQYKWMQYQSMMPKVNLTLALHFLGCNVESDS